MCQKKEDEGEIGLVVSIKKQKDKNNNLENHRITTGYSYDRKLQCCPPR